MKQENISRRLQKEEGKRIHDLMVTKSSKKAMEKFKTPAYSCYKADSKE